MHEVNGATDTVQCFKANVSDHRAVQLVPVVAALEANLAILESLDLTMAVALLDHAIAEVKQRLAP